MEGEIGKARKREGEMGMMKHERLETWGCDAPVALYGCFPISRFPALPIFGVAFRLHDGAGARGHSERGLGLFRGFTVSRFQLLPLPLCLRVSVVQRIRVYL
jgi:hypothetical protein